MAITNIQLEVTRGDSVDWDIYFNDEHNANIDITGWTLFFTVKDNAGQVDDDAKIKKDITTHTDPINGKSTISLSSSDTANLLGNYLYDIQVKKSTGQIKTIAEGILVVSKDITRRTS